jgi:hypothetical protein
MLEFCISLPLASLWVSTDFVTQEHEHGPGDVRAIGMRAGCAQVYPNISKAAKILYLLSQFLILYF